MNLQEVPSSTPSQGECKTIIRLINMMCRNNYLFSVPLETKQINQQLNLQLKQQQQHQQQQQQQQLFGPLFQPNQQLGQFKQSLQFSPFQQQQQQQIQQRIKEDNPLKYNSCIAGKKSEPFRNAIQKFYIKLVNIPYNCNENTIFQTFRSIRIPKEDLAFSYNSHGEFKNQCFIRLDSKQKLNEILNYPQFKLDKNIVEIKESKERDFNQARQSHLYSDQNQNSQICEFTSANAFVKLKGVPKSVDLLTIARLLEKYKVKQYGIKRPLIYGKPATEVYIVLENQEEALKIQELNMLHLQNSYIEVTQITLKEFQQIVTYHFIKQPPEINIQKNNIKDIEKRRKTILIEGVPQNSLKKDIRNFFGNFVLKESDITLLNQPKLEYILFKFNSDVFSGNVLVTFEDQMEAMRAIKQKNFRNFGNNYVELFEFK